MEEEKGSIMNTGAEQWLAILEYATQYKMSISTLRRRIKEGKLHHRKIRGKYFVLAPASSDQQETSCSYTGLPQILALQNEISSLKKEIESLQQQICDQQTLIQVLEDQLLQRRMKDIDGDNSLLFKQSG